MKVHLGSVVIPSGNAIIVDCGLLGDDWLTALTVAAQAQRSGEISFHNATAAAISGLPPGPFDVIGEQMPDGETLRRVEIAVREGDVARSEQLATVSVDWSRLLVIDLDALKSWKHEEPFDGKADFVFWGRDAAAVAAQVGAPALETGSFGWKDLAVAEAVSRGTPIEEIRARGELKFAFDFRPHSHHWQLLEQFRASPASSGVVEVGGARACGFSTWGDGHFGVHHDLDAAGRLLRIRIELASD